MALHPHRPIDPRKFPFYYGWVILMASTIGMISAVPGSPAGMSPFLEPMLEAYRIQRGDITLAYMLGTISAGLTTWRLGSLFDTMNARLIGTLAFLGVGLSLIFTGFGNEIYGRMVSSTSVNVPLAVSFLTLSFFFMRLTGLGIMMTIARSMIARWFTRNRSIAVAVNGVALSLSYSSAPVLIFFLVDEVGWQKAWIGMGIFFATIMTLFGYLFFRHSPKETGIPLEADSTEDDPATPTPKGTTRDGIQPLAGGERLFPVYRNFTAREATRTFSFWMFIAGIASCGLIGTGIIINMVALGTDQGLTEAQALSLLIPSAVFNIITTLILGTIGHRTRMKWVLIIIFVSLFVEILSAGHLGNLAGQIAFALGSGVAWGCFGILINLPWPRFFGNLHIGSINSYVTGISILASATGPFIFGKVRDLTGSFDLAILGCLFIVPVFLIASFKVRNPQRSFETSTHSP